MASVRNFKVGTMLLRFRVVFYNFYFFYGNIKKMREVFWFNDDG
jgi:hypothetical protein